MRYWSAVYGVLLSSLPLLSGAKPVVIFDNGRTTRLPHQRQTLHVQTPVTANFDVQIEPFPVKTPSLSPGKVVSHTIDRPYLERPLFIVGADPLSIRWLRCKRLAASLNYRQNSFQSITSKIKQSSKNAPNADENLGYTKNHASNLMLGRISLMQQIPRLTLKMNRCFFLIRRQRNLAMLTRQPRNKEKNQNAVFEILYQER